MGHHFLCTLDFSLYMDGLFEKELDGAHLREWIVRPHLVVVNLCVLDLWTYVEIHFRQYMSAEI